MYKNHKILAIIPARGGSRGVPRKNIRNLEGRPLVAWTIEEVRRSRYIDRCILSSDDDEIIRIAKQWGGDVPFVRPKKLALDDTPDIEVFLHAIEQLPGYNYIVKLQPTSPLRNIDDIDGCIEFCFANQASSCVSVTEAEHSPYWMYSLDSGNANQMRSIVPIEKEMFYQRQKLPKVFRLNGAVYIADIEWLKKNNSFIGEETLGYVMPQERSYDIDTEDDFRIVEAVLRGN